MPVLMNEMLCLLSRLHGNGWREFVHTGCVDPLLQWHQLLHWGRRRGGNRLPLLPLEGKAHRHGHILMNTHTYDAYNTTFVYQWNLSIPDTIGPEGSVLIKEVSLFQRLKCTQTQ